MAGTRRVLRWLLYKPETYWQVWLIDAGGSGLVMFIVWAAFGKPLIGLLVAVIALIARGSVQSYRLDRRRNSRLGP
jgi:hypothetical protein